MLPATYQLPAAIVLLLGGTIACFFGYRLFRIVLALFGFILGALLASSLFGASDTGPMVLAALTGGVIGAGLLIAAYFVGVAALGAGLGAAIVGLAYALADREPHVLVVVLGAVAGAIAAMSFQRYVIAAGTSFGGAWTLIVGAMALLGEPAATAVASSGDVWVVYPLHPAPGRGWVPFAWVALALAGLAVQLGVPGGEGRRPGRRIKR